MPCIKPASIHWLIPFDNPDACTTPTMQKGPDWFCLKASLQLHDLNIVDLRQVWAAKTVIGDVIVERIATLLHL